MLMLNPFDPKTPVSTSDYCIDTQEHPQCARSQYSRAR